MEISEILASFLWDIIVLSSSKIMIKSEVLML